MANRAILIPELSLTPENISLVTEEPVPGLKTKPAVRGASNEGRLDPNPVASPDASYDIDVLERTAGNVGGARAGWKDSANSVYRAKSPAHVPHHMQWLEYGTASGERFFRPKALSLQSGELLVVVVTGAGELRWFTFTDGVRNAVHTSEATVFAAGNVIMADVVQMADGELVMMILGTDAANNVRLVKKTSKGDTDATIVWHFGPTELNVQTFEGFTLTFAPKGFAIEVMENDRIAMLVKRHGTENGPGATDIVRTFSDDRGVTWVDLKTASSYVEEGYGIGANTDYFGGASIARDPETGSLNAVCGVATGLATIMVASNEPSVIGLVSDDGDNWTGLVKRNNVVATYATEDTYDWPFNPSGMVEAAVVYGDDGLAKYIGAFHGDSGNGTVAGFFDDLCMLSTRKSGISAKDGAPVIPIDTVVTKDLTCGDAFDAQVNSETGFRAPVYAEIALNRFNVTGGTASGNIDAGAAVYAGPRFVEAVNHNGVIYLFMACEDTTAVQYALGYAILNVWDELWEKGGLVTLKASALKGNVYSSTAGWMAQMTPTQQGLTVVNAGAQTLDETTKGLKVAPAAAISTFAGTFTAYGVRPNPLLFRFIMKGTTGGDLTQDDIAMRLISSNGTNFIDLSIRFDVGTSSVRVYDNNSAAYMAAGDVIDFTTVGVEVIVSIAANLAVNGIFYRVLTTDPEDAVTVRATGSAAYAAGQAAGVVETWTAGTHTATSPDATWMGVWLSRATATSVSSEGAVLWDGVFAWDASPPQIPEYAQDETPYDDGLSHGGRPPVVRSFGQYYRNGMRLAWKGAAGREGNTWDVVSANRFEGENVLRTPVARYWRSIDDSGTVSIEFNAGNGARFNPQAVALFGINASAFRFQMSASPTYATMPINVEVDVGGAAAVDRYLQEIPPAAYTLSGVDNRELVLDGVTITSQPLTPHMFRSNDRVVWYAWNTGLAKSIRIVDNEGYKVILAASGVGAASSWWIYPDKIGFDVSGGNLGQGGGYQYMRIRFEAQILYEGWYKIGHIMIGQLLDLNTSGMNPEWGWERLDDVPVSQAAIETGGVRVTNLYDGALQRYAFGWNGLRDRLGHTSLATFQGVRDSFVQLVDAHQRTKGGADPVALFHRYEDGRAQASLRSFDVIPARMIGPAQMSQVAYDCATGSLEGTVTPIMNLAPFQFIEIP